MSARSTYAYKARDSKGQIVSGTMVAASQREVGDRLRTDGKYVVNVQDNALGGEITVDPREIRRGETAKRVRREDVIAFCQQMSVMLETGVPLADAMDAFAEQMPRREFRIVLNDVRNEVYAGEPFSKAMAKWPTVFPNMMVSLMRASESSGTMAPMLGRIGDYLLKERRTARQIRGAMSYPLFMILAGLTMTVFLMAVVLPRFAAIYASRAASLPAPTRFLMAISDFFATQYLLYIPAGIGLIIAWWVWSKTATGRRQLDWLRINLPVIGPMFRRFYITRAARTLATLITSGVNVIDIISICRGVTENYYFRQLWDAMEEGVRDGKQMSDACFHSSVIPASIASMINAGEKSGKLPEVMDRIANFSEEELDAAVKQATSFIEPVMIILMGLMVGLVAMALLLPVFSMGSVVAG